METSPYRFDLTAAISEFRQDFPEHRNTVTFFDLSKLNLWNRKKLIKYAARQLHEAAQQTQPEASQNPEDVFSKFYQNAKST
ncbi:MAG: hypothetical protein ACQEQL_08530, partial [Pseudomonadota bacterium]